MLRARGFAPVPMIALVIGLAMGSALAQERELARVNDELSALGINLRSLTKEYDKPDVLGPTRTFSERLTNGEILFLLNDFSHASLVLYELVDGDKNQSEPLYPRALYYLAESLYQIGHDSAARRLFQEILARRDPQHVKDAVKLFPVNSLDQVIAKALLAAPVVGEAAVD